MTANSLDSPNVLEGGMAIDVIHTSKDILLKNGQNSTYINFIFTVILLSGQS